MTTLYENLKNNKTATQNWSNYGEFKTGKELKNDNEWIIKDLQYMLSMGYLDKPDDEYERQYNSTECNQIKRILKQYNK